MGRAANSPSAMRHTITIEQATETDDNRGGVTESWATYCTAYARIDPVSSREAFAAGQLQGSITHRVTIRFQSGVQPKMRVTWGSRSFLITGVRTKDEERRIIVLDCIEERT